MSTLSAEAPVVGTTSTAVHSAALPYWRRALAFGTGFGIAIGERNLEAAIVRARPSGATPVAGTTIQDFRNRPAAEWGAELMRFVNRAGGSRLAATVLLPRNEVVVRTLSLPGVADRDAASAIELQIDTLHPWGDAEVAWAWSRVGQGDLMVGLARKDLLASYETLFAEAGIAIAAITFSPAVIHAALRIWHTTPNPVLCFCSEENGRVEVYGESPARGAFSAEFAFAAGRAAAMARAELRIAPDYPMRRLAEILPGSPSAEWSGNPLAYAAALAGSAPRVARFANLLPAERRASHDRVQYLIPAALGVLLVIALLTAYLIVPAVGQRSYRNELERASKRLEPSAEHARRLEREIGQDTGRVRLLDEIRRRPQDDLEVLNELTRILPPTVWTNAVEIHPDSVTIAGEADQAAPLLKVLDSSPLFQNSEFILSVTRSAQGGPQANPTELFRIKTMRRGRVGRTTP